MYAAVICLPPLSGKDENGYVCQQGVETWPTFGIKGTHKKRPLRPVTAFVADSIKSNFRNISPCRMTTSLVHENVRWRHLKSVQTHCRIFLDIDLNDLAVLALALVLDIVAKVVVPVWLGLLCGIKHVLELHASASGGRHVDSEPAWIADEAKASTGHQRAYPAGVKGQSYGMHIHRHGGSSEAGRRWRLSPGQLLHELNARDGTESVT